MKICGIVIAYHPTEKVMKSIKCYLKEIEKLYIIDNSSIKNEELFSDSKIEYIWNKKNLGVAKALNIGIKKAQEQGFKYVLTMDQDSYFEKDGFKTFIKEVEKNMNNNIAIYSPLHKTLSAKVNRNITTDSLVVMTSGNIINVEIWKKLDGFKEWLFIDGVDQEYCLNARKSGYDIKIFNDVFLIHNLGNIKEKKCFGHSFLVTNHNYARRYFITRNRLYINRMYENLFPEFCKQELNNSKKEFLKILLFENNKHKKIKYIFKAKKDFKNGIKGIPNDLKEVLK